MNIRIVTLLLFLGSIPSALGMSGFRSLFVSSKQQKNADLVHTLSKEYMPATIDYFYNGYNFATTGGLIRTLWIADLQRSLNNRMEFMAQMSNANEYALRKLRDQMYQSQDEYEKNELKKRIEEINENDLRATKLFMDAHKDRQKLYDAGPIRYKIARWCSKMLG